MDIKKIDVFTYSPQKGVKIKVGRLYTKDKKVTFTKTVDSTRHKMRIFDGYGIQKDVYDKHLRGKQGRIIIKERDTGKVLVASIKTWAEHHSGQNFGDGKQIFLTTKYFRDVINTNYRIEPLKIGKEYLRNCKSCGIVYLREGDKYCSQECAIANRIGKKYDKETCNKISAALLGHSVSKETRKKISIANQGKLKNVPKPFGFGEKISRALKGRKLSQEHIKNLSLALKGKQSAKKGKPTNFRGEKHWNWQGGKTKMSISLRNSIEMKEWRNNIFIRNDYRCTKCGARNGEGKRIILEADHIIPLSILLIKNEIKSIEQAYLCKEIWDLDNGRTLCQQCHNLEPTTRANNITMKKMYMHNSDNFDREDVKEKEITQEDYKTSLKVHLAAMKAALHK